MTLLHPVFLGLAALVALIIVAAHLRHAHRRRRLGDFFGGARGAGRVAPLGLYRVRSERIIVLALATLALGLGASEPVRPSLPETAPSVRGSSIAIAIDVSVSMQAADFAPTRLARAVEVAEGVLGDLETTKVGLVLFAGRGYTLAPLTGDLEVPAFFLEGIGPTVTSLQDPGSLLTSGLGEAAGLLISEDGSRELGIVLITDGEAGESVDAVLEAVRAVAQQGIVVHAVGVGTPRGAEMFVSGIRGGEELVRDRVGAPGISRLQESLLWRVADAGGGEYAFEGDAPALRRIRRAATSGAASSRTTALEFAGTDLTLVLLGGGLVLLVLDSLLEVRIRRRAWSGRGRAR